MEYEEKIPRKVRTFLDPDHPNSQHLGCADQSFSSVEADFVTKIRGFSKTAFDWTNVQGKGYIVSILHGLYDCEKAAEDLNTALRADFPQGVCLYDCDNTKLDTVFSRKKLLAAALRAKIIERAAFDIRGFLSHFIITAVAAVLGAAASILSLAQQQQLAVSALMISSIVFVICALLGFRSYGRDSNSASYAILTTALSTCDPSVYKTLMGEMGNPDSSRLYKTKINIFLRLDKLEEYDGAASAAVWHYLRTAPQHEQMNILFLSNDQFRSVAHSPNANFRYGLFEIIPLNFREKLELKSKCLSAIQESRLYCFGVDAILERIPKSPERKDAIEKVYQRIESFARSCEQAGNTALTALYLLAFLTSEYDLYLSPKEMEATLSNKSYARITSLFFKQRPEAKYLQDVISIAFREFGDSYMLVSDTGRYRFKRVVVDAIISLGRLRLLSEIDTYAW